MENSGYGPTHLPSPALVVFSQAAGSLGEALRIQRPFHSQLSDAKELHHLSLVGSYGAHLLHGFPPHLLHPMPPVSSASTTFSGGGAFVKPFPSNFSLPSAFAPPKCLGMEQKYGFQGMMFGGNNGSNNGNGSSSANSNSGGNGGGTSSESFRTDSSSPACASLSPPVKEESLEGHTSEEGDRDRICSPSDRSPPETPGFRPAPKTTSSSGTEPLNLRMDNNGFYPFYRTSLSNSFAKRYLLQQQGVGGGMKKPMIGSSSPNSCPVCGIQLSPAELETHFLSELDRLYKLSTGNERQKIKASLGLTASSMHNTSDLQGTDSRWETFQRIRTNRQGRLRAKTRKRRSDSENEYMDMGNGNPVCQNCPVCHGRLQRTPEEIGQHIEECLRKSRQIINDEDETVDVESYGDDSSPNSAMNMTQQNNLNNNNNNNNNNNLTKLEQATAILHTPHQQQQLQQQQQQQQQQQHREENAITSLSSLHTPWERKARINCPPPPMPPVNTISRATPTSTNQRIDMDYDQDHEHDNDNDEEVIVDNTDDEEISSKRMRMTSEKHEIKNNTEEATSSVEIDSATDPNNTTKSSHMTPDSYVSTSESSEPSSKAQVLEELRARIRELEESPLKNGGRQSADEANYKCYICKEPFKAPVISTLCWHVHCDNCWITISDSKKSCPQCKLITTSTDLKKIQV